MYLERETDRQRQRQRDTECRQRQRQRDTECRQRQRDTECRQRQRDTECRHLKFHTRLTFWDALVLPTNCTSFFSDTVSLRDVTPRAARSRRSAAKMPDHLHLDFSTGSQHVSLRLRRSEHIHMGRLPVFTVGDDQKLVKASLPDATVSAWLLRNLSLSHVAYIFGRP